MPIFHHSRLRRKRKPMFSFAVLLSPCLSPLFSSSFHFRQLQNYQFHPFLRLSCIRPVHTFVLHLDTQFLLFVNFAASHSCFPRLVFRFVYPLCCGGSGAEAKKRTLRRNCCPSVCPRISDFVNLRCSELPAGVFPQVPDPPCRRLLEKQSRESP